MKLNHNSFSAKVYRWFFMKTEMPSNLCPYFWKLVLAFTLSVPVLIVTAVYELFFIKNQSKKPADSPSERFVLGLLCWPVLFLTVAVLSPILLFWITPENNSILWNLISAGIVTWAIAIIFGIIAGVKHLKEKRDDVKWNNRNSDNVYDENGNWIPLEDRIIEKKPNLIVEFIKAKYNKYCPKIDWKR